MIMLRKLLVIRGRIGGGQGFEEGPGDGHIVVG